MTVHKIKKKIIDLSREKAKKMGGWSRRMEWRRRRS